MKNKIIQGDCLEVMKDISDNSIDLIINDPPYNIGKAKWDKIDNYIEWMGKVFKECERVLKDNGSFYFFHNDFLQIVELQNWINNNTKFIFKQLITWNKIHENFRNFGYVQHRLSINMMRNYYKGFTEYCLYYTFQDETGLSKISIKDNFLSISEKIRKYVENNFSREYIHKLFLNEGRYSTELSARVHSAYKMGWGNGKRFDLMDEKLFYYLNEYLKFPFNYKDLKQEYESLRYNFNVAIVKKDIRANSNVWLYPPSEKKGHITPKPVELIENIIKHSSSENDIILDCFIGSGTTAIACINTNRFFIGIEKEQKYVDMANKRIEEYNKL